MTMLKHLGIILGVFANLFSSLAVTHAQSDTSIPAQVVAITDGDTLAVQLVVDGRTERVRLIGIDTPEEFDPRRPVQCFAVEAAQRLGELSMGRRVAVELDVVERDRFGRLLAYLWLTDDDGTTWMLNERMVADGSAQLLSIPPTETSRVST